MEIVKKIFQWAVYSSKNPQNFSLTLKAVIPLLAFFGLESITPDVEGGIQSLVDAVAFAGQAVTAFIAGYGFLRKIILTFKSK